MYDWENVRLQQSFNSCDCWQGTVTRLSSLVLEDDNSCHEQVIASYFPNSKTQNVHITTDLPGYVLLYFARQFHSSSNLKLSSGLLPAERFAEHVKILVHQKENIEYDLKKAHAEKVRIWTTDVVAVWLTWFEWFTLLSSKRLCKKMTSYAKCWSPLNVLCRTKLLRTRNFNVCSKKRNENGWSSWINHHKNSLGDCDQPDSLFGT